MRIVGPEQRRCPPEFQARITRSFGTTIFGEPLFKVVWGQSYFHKMGNVWRDVYGNERRGYRDRYLCHGMPCWNILKWKSAKEYGTPELWYHNTWDAVSKTFILGEYPWKGRYEVLQSLYRHEKQIVNGRLELKVIPFPLSHILIDMVIPMLIEAQRMTIEEKRAAQEFVMQQEAKQESKEISERMMENLPAFYGPVSFSKQGCRTALLDKKMHAIQQMWNKLSRGGQKPVFQKGMFQGQAPIRLSGKPN